MKIVVRYKGGAGSGNFGHAGIPGHAGGSAPGKATQRHGHDAHPQIIINVEHETGAKFGPPSKFTVNIIKSAVKGKVSLSVWNASGWFSNKTEYIEDSLRDVFPWVESSAHTHKGDYHDQAYCSFQRW